eukprot:324430-Chlamydomonas_euryale.AAC.1
MEGVPTLSTDRPSARSPTHLSLPRRPAPAQTELAIGPLGHRVALSRSIKSLGNGDDGLGDGDGGSDAIAAYYQRGRP